MEGAHDDDLAARFCICWRITGVREGAAPPKGWLEGGVRFGEKDDLPR
jgi:hypothetical protein